MIRRADAISDQAIKDQRPITIGAVTGTRRGVKALRGRVEVEIEVGGHLAVFMLRPEVEVEVGGK